MDWDIFISHAWEDKESIARPLARALEEKGFRVWFDEFTLTVGDGLRRSIDKGLANSQYGVVILSPYFFAKKWPQIELDGLASRETLNDKVILPVWHNITAEQIGNYSPMLAGRLAVSSDRGVDFVVTELLRAIHIPPAGREVESKPKIESMMPSQLQKLSDTDSPRMPFSFPSFSELKDSVLLRVKQQILGQELEEGWVRQIVWVKGQQAIIVASSAIGLFNISNGRALWKLKRYAECGALNPNGILLVLGGLYTRDYFGYREHDITSVELWDIRTGLNRETLEGHTDKVTSVSFSLDGALLATASRDKTVKLWQVETGTLLNSFEYVDQVNSVSFSPSGRLIACGLENGTVQIWKVIDNVLLRTLAWHNASVNAVSFSPNGQILASCSDDNKIILWRVADWSRLFTLAGHTSSVECVAFSPNGQLLASGSDDKTVRLWRVADATLLSTLKGHKERVTSIIFSSDGETLISGSSTIRTWRVT